jgi:hypothetical protein
MQNMNRDFEFRQMLRAYRKGIISEATFEQEVSELERGLTANGAGAKNSSSERDEIIKFIDQLRANQACSGQAFVKWVQACKTDCVRGGLTMVAERESYHARVFEQRLRELGAEPRAKEAAGVLEFHEYFPDNSLSDGQKLLRLTASFPVPKEAVQYFFDFAEKIKDDLNTKEMIKLYAQDELSSATWLLESCAALNAPANKVATTSSMGAMNA